MWALPWRASGVFPDWQRTGFYHDAIQRARVRLGGILPITCGVAVLPRRFAARVPGARFWGPDVGASSNWVNAVWRGGSRQGA